MKKIREFVDNAKLKTKFVGLALSISLIISVTILITSIYGGKSALQSQITSGITNIAELKASHINEFYNRAVANLEITTESHIVQSAVIDSSWSNPNTRKLLLKAFNDCRNYHDYYRISLVSNKHNVLISTDSYYEGKDLDIDLIKTTRLSDGNISNSNIYKHGDMFMISFLEAITNEYNEVLAYVEIDIDMEPVYQMIQNSDGLGKTGETLLGMQTETGALFLNPLRHDNSAALARTAKFGDKAARPILEATQGKAGEGILADYRGEEVISVWRYVPSFQWGLVTKIDLSEALEPVYTLRNALIFIALIITLIGIIASIKFANIITVPINKLRDAMRVFGNGNVLENKLVKTSNDEVGEMIDQANNLVDFQRNIIEFTEEIGKGNFSFESSHDISQGDLGKELLKMKSSLQAVSEDEKKRNWVTEGLAKFANILRNNNDDLNLLSDNIISNLINYLGANQGGLFIISDDLKSPKMVLTSSYAYERKKFMEKEFGIGEGLIGQCWQEKDKILLTEIPQSYISITSGLGTTNPSCILIMPLMINEDIYGIIEIASFSVLEDYQVEFVEKLASSIASTLSSVKANLKTSSLLEESQQMGEELQAQEEELRQNAEEMQATQEEMERAQKELVKKEGILRAIFDNMDDTIFAINLNYEITMVNATIKKKYKGLGIDLNLGKNILEILPPDKKEFWKDRYDRALSGEKFETIDDLAPGVKAKVYHFPTFDDQNEISGAAVVSRVLISKENG